MLNRAFRRKNSVKPEPQKEPRQLDEIQKEYSQVSGQFAQSEYQAKLYAEEAKRLFSQMRALNVEAGDRQKLDSEAKDKEVKNAE